MVKHLIFGKPFPTKTILFSIEPTSSYPNLTVNENDGYDLTYPLRKQTRIFGLGEATGPLNKRGMFKVSLNSDTAHHEDDNYSLYSSHNFLLLEGDDHLGIFVDSPARVVFDLGHSDPDRLKIHSDHPFSLYLIEGDSSEAICHVFRSLIGESYVPPLWGFGYGQSRFSYFSQSEVLKVARKYRKHQLPLDYICLDIHYMDHFEDFTFDKDKFPDVPALTSELAESYGVHIVPIVDAGIKVKQGSPAYEEGVKGGYFVTNKEGLPFQAKVWPGMTHFVDFLKDGAKEFFGRQFDFYADQGIDGFWLDMNEPSIFASEYSMNRPKSEKKAEGGPYWEGNGFLSDYQSFFHEFEGKKINHYDVHNLYGGLLSEAVYEWGKRRFGHRFLSFGRSTYIGSHRYGGIWTGDNHSSYDQLLLNIRMMPGLNMAGFLFSGADTGGFGEKCSRDLLLRWLQFSIFTPLLRNHSAIFTRRQECYAYLGKKDFRTVLGLRYRLLPYIYSEYLRCVKENDLLLKPLSFLYPDDDEAAEIEDELLFGDGLLLCPVHEKGKGREIYLPEPMTLLRYDGKDFHLEKMAAGHHHLAYSTKEVCFFLRPGKSFIYGDYALSTRDVDLRKVSKIGDGDYTQYLDDGFSFDLDRLEKRLIK